MSGIKYSRARESQAKGMGSGSEGWTCDHISRHTMRKLRTKNDDQSGTWQTLTLFLGMEEMTSRKKYEQS